MFWTILCYVYTNFISYNILGTYHTIHDRYTRFPGDYQMYKAHTGEVLQAPIRYVIRGPDIGHDCFCSWWLSVHDDVIKWKHFPRYWPFVRGIHRSPVNSPHKGQWRGALMFSLICARMNGWVNDGDAGDLRHHRAHYDVSVMWCIIRHQLARRWS